MRAICSWQESVTHPFHKNRIFCPTDEREALVVHPCQGAQKMTRFMGHFTMPHGHWQLLEKRGDVPSSQVAWNHMGIFREAALESHHMPCCRGVSGDASIFESVLFL